MVNNVSYVIYVRYVISVTDMASYLGLNVSPVYRHVTLYRAIVQLSLREDRTGVCVAWPRQEMVIVITDSVPSVDQDLVVVGGTFNSDTSQLAPTLVT